jgi:hypothetical protein
MTVLDPTCDPQSPLFISRLDPLFRSDVTLVKDRPTQAFLAACRRLEFDHSSPSRRGPGRPRKNSVEQTPDKELALAAPMNAQQEIKRLKNFRLTKFEFGFITGLEGHEPNPSQQVTLNKIINRYSHMMGTEGNYGQQPLRN